MVVLGFKGFILTGALVLCPDFHSPVAHHAYRNFPVPSSRGERRFIPRRDYDQGWNLRSSHSISRKDMLLYDGLNDRRSHGQGRTLEKYSQSVQNPLS